MATITRGPADNYVESIKHCLEKYELEHPGADAALYRQNSGSVRVRIVDDRFAKLDISKRHDAVWAFLTSELPDDTVQEISILLLLAPGEEKSSFMNLEFDDPLPSRL